MITVSETHYPTKNYVEFVVRVPHADLVSIKLDGIEQAQMRQPRSTAADVLLDLHTLAFRQQQQEVKS